MYKLKSIINCCKKKEKVFIFFKYCELMIDKEEQQFIDLYESSKKKDDLSDSYLQGIYYLRK